MTTTISFLALAVLLPVLFIIDHQHQYINCQHVHEIHNAIVLIRGGPKSGGLVRGELRFRENKNGRVNIRGQIEGLAKGQHGMHVHQWGDISLGCEKAGSHFDAHHAAHGARGSHAHTGDFGNIVAADNGVARVNINDSFVELHGDNSIVGRAILVHEHRDDLGQGGNNKSLITGNAGSPVGCGVVAWDD
ncbi:superoxide dismutase [Cu-Zn]-like [Oppia nitens]|uniref:superoxide dismutase [Cu-Zn]-like n=1 Tax=Oppia nitens TaxID=1686743 RepID=UPI0023DC95E3|nr:superoxide dismutase [Cu-Zn]-like [Oppia nitens]